MNGLIYCATNSKNGKQYVGQTLRTMAARKRQHINRLDSWRFGQAIAKYGAAAFVWKTLQSGIASQAALDAAEIYWIAALDTFHNGYNANTGGKHFTVSDETREKLRLIGLGRKQSPETIAKRVAHLIGRKRDPGVVARMAAAHRGMKRTPETRAKLKAFATTIEQIIERRARLERQRSNPEFCSAINAARRDPAYRAKAQIAATARWADPECRGRNAASNALTWSDPDLLAQHSALTQAMWDDPEYRKKQAAARSPEYRAKMSAAVKAGKARAANAKVQESLLPNALDDILKSPHHVALAA